MKWEGQEQSRNVEDRRGQGGLRRVGGRGIGIGTIVIAVLAGWVKVEDCQPICGVCGMVGGACGKEELREAGVDVEQFQPAFADVYGDALRQIGLPPERVMRWLARLLS